MECDGIISLTGCHHGQACEFTSRPHFTLTPPSPPPPPSPRPRLAPTSPSPHPHLYVRWVWPSTRCWCSSSNQRISTYSNSGTFRSTEGSTALARRSRSLLLGRECKARSMCTHSRRWLAPWRGGVLTCATSEWSRAETRGAPCCAYSTASSRCPWPCLAPGLFPHARPY